MEESSFETLEALAMAICRRLKEGLPAPKHPASKEDYRFRVCLEKPIAVTLADAPCVELSVYARDVEGLR